MIQRNVTKATREMIHEAFVLAQNIMRQRGEALTKTERRSIHKFISMALSGSKVGEIRCMDCDKIVNIASLYLKTKHGENKNGK